MSILKKTLTYSLFLVSLLLVVACVERASESEIDEACQHFVGYKSTQDPAADAELLSKCQQDLHRERVSKEVAQCRAKAPDLDTFWNKCR